MLERERSSKYFVVLTTVVEFIDFGTAQNQSGLKSIRILEKYFDKIQLIYRLFY